MEYAGFIYETTNTINGRKYIGSHKGNITDPYLGSGSVLQKAFKKYGRSAFLREVLLYVFNIEDLRVLEAEILTEKNCANNPLYYNITNCTTGKKYDFIKMNTAKVKQRMIENNPNKGGKARREHNARFGPPKHKRYRLTESGREKIVETMTKRNPCAGLSPWELMSATKQSVYLWKQADVYYQWWLENKDKSYYRMARAFGFESPTMTHNNLIKKFRNSWNPLLDEKWIKLRKDNNG